MPWIRKDGKKVWVEDDSPEALNDPLLRVKVLGEKGDPIRELDHSGAYDPRYETECGACGKRRPVDDEPCECTL